MYALTAADLLDVWERGRHKSPEQHAVLLLAAGRPDQSVGQAAELSIGRRDAQLLSLREGTFGPHGTGLADCPDCGLRVQIDLTLHELCVPAPDDVATWPMAVGDIEVKYRLPNSLDLIAVAHFNEVEAIRRALFERCLVEIRAAGQPYPIDHLTPEVLSAIEEQMAQHDPQAQVQLILTCPHCAHAWSTTFDIVSFFWAEIDARARRLLHEVHALASTYGWREAEILSMSADRRQAYLDLINP